MATNTFIPVTFNDGEPLDPVKLNKLVDNISNIYQSSAISLSNSTTGSTPQVPVIFTYRYTFQNVKAGASAQTHSFSFSGKFTDAELTAGKVFVTTGITNAIGDNDNVNIAVGDIKTGNPKIFCSMTGTGTRNVSVDIIAICMKDII